MYYEAKCTLCSRVLEDEEMNADAFAGAREPYDDIVFLMIRCDPCHAKTVVCDGGEC